MMITSAMKLDKQSVQKFVTNPLFRSIMPLYNKTGNDPLVDFPGEWALLAFKSTIRSLPVTLYQIEPNCKGYQELDGL